MLWAGGSTKMIQMSCFLNMKIYKRFVGVRPLVWAVLASQYMGKRVRSRFSPFFSSLP